MSNPFDIKLTLLSKWNNTQLKDVEDLADMIVDVWYEAENFAIETVQEHTMTNTSVSGFLKLCSCGEAVDDYQEHLTYKISGYSEETL